MTNNTIDLSNLNPRMAEAVRNFFDSVTKEGGDNEVLYLCGGKRVDNGTDDPFDNGWSSTGRFSGTRGPVDLLMMLASMCSSILWLSHEAGMPKELMARLMHGALHFAMDQHNSRITAVPTDPEEADMPDIGAMLAKLMDKGGNVH